VAATVAAEKKDEGTSPEQIELQKEKDALEKKNAEMAKREKDLNDKVNKQNREIEALKVK